MRVRVLDGDRSCLAGVPVLDPGPALPPHRVKTVVVEEDGRVIGTMSVLLVSYIESAWLDRDHRNAGVVRAMVRKAWDLASDDGATWGFSAAADDGVAKVLTRLGGTELPARFFLMPFYGKPKEGESCRQQ